MQGGAVQKIISPHDASKDMQGQDQEADIILNQERYMCTLDL